MILTDFHKILVADASFVFSRTKRLRRILGSLRDLIKVHFACFRVLSHESFRQRPASLSLSHFTIRVRSVILLLSSDLRLIRGTCMQ